MAKLHAGRAVPIPGVDAFRTGNDQRLFLLEFLERMVADDVLGTRLFHASFKGDDVEKAFVTFRIFGLFGIST